MFSCYIYLTRKCPRDCDYCSLKDNSFNELTVDQWIEAFAILQDMGLDFLFTGGNESLLLGDDLKKIFSTVKIPYCILTSVPSPLFNKYKYLYLPDEDGFYLDNFSVATDFSLESFKDKSVLSKLEKKTLDGWIGLMWAYDYSPSERWGCMTVSNKNKEQILDVVNKLISLETHIDLNLIHYAQDDSYDYFPPRDAIKDYLFETDKDKEYLCNKLKEVINLTGNNQKIQKYITHHRIAYYKAIIDDPERYLNYRWHCAGEPQDGPSIDADGSLRACLYRPGKRTSKMSIFDLPKKKDQWLESVYYDCLECPGCAWEGGFMYKYSKMLYYSPYINTKKDASSCFDFNRENI